MTDSQFEPEQIAPPIEGEIPDTRGKKSRKTLVIVLVALAIGLCLCAVICVIAGGTGIVRVALERDDVELVLDQFMQAMARKDVDAAYALYSARAQRQMPRSRLEELLQGNNLALFDGYTSLQVMNLNISKAINTNPDLPQGTIAKVSGSVSYEGGFTGRFEAILERENDAWKLHYINITVPPDKIGN